jgi:beta-glucosidase
MTNWFDRSEEITSRIPKGFIFGAATSSWQIEGSSHTRGRSIWEDFCDLPGKILDGAGADPATDHINRLEGDLDLLARLGVDSYRFSVSWPRILHEGHGPVDPKGLEFYDRLIDGLLERNIKPALTLYHWDLPSALQAKGGWANKEIYEHFEN